MCQRTIGLTLEEARRGCSGGGAAKRTWRLGFICDGGCFCCCCRELEDRGGSARWWCGAAEDDDV